MPKSDATFVNLSQEYEVNYVLKSNGYRETAENRTKLIQYTKNNLSSGENARRDAIERNLSRMNLEK